jgi:hypothetical protein
MSAVLILLTLSALIGFGLHRFSWRAIAISSVMLALLSAFVLQMKGLGTLTGIAIIVVCLTVSQVAYLMGVLFVDQWPGGEGPDQGRSGIGSDFPI